LRSGSRRGDRGATPPELSDWQAGLRDSLARSALAREAVFGGATALSAVYLHHRRSEDIDLFLQREPVFRT
jgi:hypothetical protein